MFINKFPAAAAVSIYFFPIMNLFASEQSTRGLYGSVEYGYTQEQLTDISNKTTQSGLSQNYTLGKRGSVYSPKLLSYLLQGSFFTNDTEGSSNGVAKESSLKSVNYRLNTNFIQVTKFPFSIYGEKTSTPYASVQSTSTISYNQLTDSYGINGAADLPYFKFRYSAIASNMKRDEISATETRDEKSYMADIYKDFDNGRLSATYNGSTRGYSRDSTDFLTKNEFNNQSNSIKVNGLWKAGKTLSIGSYVTYLNTSTASADMNSLTGNLNVAWNPTVNYAASMNVAASTLKAGESGVDTLMVSGSSSYRVTPELSTTQNISINRVSSDYTENTMELVTVGANYVKSLENDLVLSSNVNFMVKGEQNNAASDVNSTVVDKDAYSYTLGGGLSKRFESIGSTLSSNMSYYNSTSSLNEEENRINVNLLLSSMLWMNLTNSLSVYYLKEHGTYFAGQNFGFLVRDAQVRTVDNQLNYWQTVGYNGRLSIGGGVTYSVSQSGESDTITRIFPHLNGSFSYSFFNAVQFTSSAMVSQDSVSDLTNYSVNIGLNYRIRAILMSLGEHYYLQTGQSGERRDMNSILFRISRSF